MTRQNENREKLLQLIQGRPGLGIRDASRRTGIPQGALAYHVEYLEREGKVSSARFGGKRLLFPYKVAPRGRDLAMTVLLEDPHLFEAFSFVRALGPVSQKGLLEVIKEPRASVQHRLDKLVKGGLVKTGYVGRSRIYEVA